MVKPTIRPTFELQLASDSAAVLADLRRRLADGTYPLRMQSVGAHFTICPLERDVQFWSPWLDLRIESGEAGTRIIGRFSPRPSVWTGFMCAYFGLVTAGFFAGIWGAALLLIGERPFPLWITLGCAVVMALLFWSSQIGQRLAHDQMEQIKAIVFEILDASEDAPADDRRD